MAANYRSVNANTQPVNPPLQRLRITGIVRATFLASFYKCLQQMLASRRRNYSRANIEARSPKWGALYLIRLVVVRIE